MRIAREREIDTTKLAAQSSFSAAGVKISGLAEMPAIIQHKRWPWAEDCLYLFGRDPHSIRYNAQIFVHIFPMPEGRNCFQKELGFYRKQKKGFLLEGHKFKRAMLAPKAEEGTDHEAFQTRDGIHRRRIVHAFRAENRAVLLVYSLDSAQFLSSSFFEKLKSHIAIGV